MVERRAPTTAKVLAMIGTDANLSAAAQDAIAKRHSHTTAKNNLAANVTMTTANTFYDGASVSLGVGTWLIEAVITVQSPNATAMRVTAKLWNGTSVEQSSEATIPSMGTSVKGIVSIKLIGIVVLTGTETWKISATATAASFIILAAAQDNGAGNNATSIRAVKVS